MVSAAACRHDPAPAVHSAAVVADVLEDVHGHDGVEAVGAPAFDPAGRAHGVANNPDIGPIVEPLGALSHALGLGVDA
jgi:hypothetical protein